MNFPKQFYNKLQNNRITFLDRSGYPVDEETFVRNNYDLYNFYKGPQNFNSLLKISL